MTEKEKEILSYVTPYIEYMWAARIAGIILECDFRDVKTELDKQDLRR